jgi:hypothetical protein
MNWAVLISWPFLPRSVHVKLATYASHGHTLGFAEQGWECERPIGKSLLGGTGQVAENHVGCDHGIQIVAERTLHFAVVDDFPDKPGCLRKNAANLRRELFVTFEQNTLKKEANLGGFGE